MYTLKESEDDIKFTTILLGGSIGEKPVTRISDVKGDSIKYYNTIFDTKEEAKEEAKRQNKTLSPGEKSYYGLKYVVAEIKDEKFTGK